MQWKHVNAIIMAAIIAWSSYAFAAAGDDDDSDEAPVVKSVHKKPKAAPKPAAAASDTARKDEKKEEKTAFLPCPDTIDVAPQSLAKKEADWDSFVDDTLQYTLSDAAVYIYKTSFEKLQQTSGTETLTQWDLPDNAKDKYFVVCSYANTSVRLKRPLDAALKTCRYSFTPNTTSSSGPPLVRKMTCE